MPEEKKGLKALIAALDIFAVVTQLEEEDFDEASRHVGLSGATYGTLWGLQTGGTPEALDLLDLMGEVNTFMRQLKGDKTFKFAVQALLAKLADGETELPNYLVYQFSESWKPPIN